MVRNQVGRFSRSLDLTQFKVIGRQLGSYETGLLMGRN